MRRLIFALVMIALIAVPGLQAQEDSTPAINAFTTTATEVSGTALLNRSALVPVAWEVLNRPVTANLFFEQVFADGSSINVELPRLIPWVASAGSGVVAPRNPGGDAETITLRLRLVDLLNQEVYSTAEIELPIQEGDGSVPPGDSPVAMISRFSVNSTTVSRELLANNTARIPVVWTVVNRPSTANLFFEQVLPDVGAVNVELPRSNPWIASAGDGVVAPRDPGDEYDQIHLRVRLVDLVNGRVYDQADMFVTISNEGPPQASIRTFTANAESVKKDQLEAGTVRIPVSWAVDSRPDNSNLVFEQVLDDGTVVNVELPRTVPIIPSSGNGVVAPKAPGGDAEEIQLQVRLIDVSDQTEYDKKELTIPIDDTPAEAAQITSFSTNAESVSENALANGIARVPVTWASVNRPLDSNLVFEQVLDDGTVVNVELPRVNPIVPSSGVGVMAPKPPGGDATEVQLQLRLIDISSGTEYDKREITLPITEEPVEEPDITNFSTSAEQVGETALANGTARVPVTWASTNRPADSNLVFEQVLDDGTVVNVELPRTNPIVPSSGVGVMAPKPPGGDATEIQLQLRLIDIDSGTEYDKREITLPISDEPGTVPEITSFGTSAEDVSAAELKDGTARIPVTWTTRNRPENSNLYFEQRLPDSLVNVELPRTVPIVPSTGSGVVAPEWPGEGETSITLVLRLVSLSNDATLDSIEFDLPIAGLDEEAIDTDADTETDTDTDADADAGGGGANTVACEFGDTFEPDDCPTSQTTVQAAYQAYENGIMVWRGDTRQIYALYDDGSYWVYPDTWTEDQPADTGETPPDGFVLPARGFGLVWANESGVRDKLGWATGEEMSYSTKLEVYEPADSPTTVYLLIPDGRTLIVTDDWQAR